MMCMGFASLRSGRTESFASICVLAGVLGGVQDTWLFEALFYLNLLFQCLAVLALALMTHSPYRKFVKVFGDLSYPRVSRSLAGRVCYRRALFSRPVARPWSDDCYAVGVDGLCLCRLPFSGCADRAASVGHPDEGCDDKWDCQRGREVAVAALELAAGGQITVLPADRLRRVAQIGPRAASAPVDLQEERRPAWGLHEAEARHQFRRALRRPPALGVLRHPVASPI
jgi:hypothetical protein